MSFYEWVSISQHPPPVGDW